MGVYSLKERGRRQFWLSHSCVSLVETRCHHLVSSLPCRDRRRIPRRLPPAPGPGRAGILPTDRKGSRHDTTHWKYTANRRKGFPSRHNTLGVHCQQTESFPIITQHSGSTLPTDRKFSHHYTTLWEYTANRQKVFPSLHNTLGIHCQHRKFSHHYTTLWEYTANRQKVFPSLHNTLGIHCQQTERVPVTTQDSGNTLPTDRKGSRHNALGIHCQQTERVSVTTHWEYAANRQKGFCHNTLGTHCQQTERVPATLGLCQQKERVAITTPHTGNTLPTDKKGFPSHRDAVN